MIGGRKVGCRLGCRINLTTFWGKVQWRRRRRGTVTSLATSKISSGFPRPVPEFTPNLGSMPPLASINTDRRAGQDPGQSAVQRPPSGCSPAVTPPKTLQDTAANRGGLGPGCHGPPSYPLSPVSHSTAVQQPVAPRTGSQFAASGVGIMFRTSTRCCARARYTPKLVHSPFLLSD